MYRNVTISVVIPCLNEEKGIAETLRHIPEIVDEVVVVDNGSTDRTPEIAQSMGAVVAHETVRGYGSAKVRGFKTATKDVIVTADGDGTYPVASIPVLVDALLDSDAGFICGCRFPLDNPDSMAFRNVAGNKVVTWSMSLIFGKSFKDGLSGMYCFRRELLPHFYLISKGWNFSEEIKLEAALHPKIGFRDCHIPYHERHGTSKLSPWAVGVDNMLFLLKKKFLLPHPARRYRREQAAGQP
jgi:glycosyltransferase involved in cell wall biosynthesis